MVESGTEKDRAVRLEIRKYPNRRYYDTTRSRHLTLEEIHTAIRGGCEIQVTDSKTGQDITAKVLAQIILELDPPKLSVFPVALLHRLLRSNEQLVQDFTDKYFNRALSAFLDSQKNFEQYLRQAMGLPSSAPTAADWARMMWGPFNPSLWGGGARGPGPTEPIADSAMASAPREDLRPLVDELRRQNVDLHRQVEKATAKRRGGTARPRKARRA
jgi:polyhydroxyalkanoate synthesis repressor PhaR